MYKSTGLTNVNVVNSWKDIAEYLGRGVRTAQRWEQNLGLPVRRPHGKSRSTVIAMKSELDQWMLSSPIGLTHAERTKPVFHQFPPMLRLNFEAMVEKRTQLIESSSTVRQKVANIRASLTCTRALTRKLLALRTMEDMGCKIQLDPVHKLNLSPQNEEPRAHVASD